MEREVELQQLKLAGGYYIGQRIQARHCILVRGQVVVKKYCKGMVHGPSLNHPTERLNVLFEVHGRPTSFDLEPMAVMARANGHEGEEVRGENEARLLRAGWMEELEPAFVQLSDAAGKEAEQEAGAQSGEDALIAHAAED